MAISYVASGSANATSASFSAPNVGDLILVYAWRPTNSNAPSLASGYTQIDVRDGTAPSARLGFKVSDGTETSTGTWTNASTVAYAIIRGADPADPVGGYARSAGSFSSSIIYAAVTLEDTGGSSWLVFFGSHTNAGANIANPPTGATNRHSRTPAPSSNNAVAVHDTNGGVSSWSQQTVAAGASGDRITYGIEILGPPAPTGTLAATEYADSAAATGMLGHLGSIATTEASDTAAAAGKLGHAGTAAAIEDGDSATAAGVLGHLAAMAATEAPDVAAMAGRTSNKGTLAATEDSDTFAAAGIATQPRWPTWSPPGEVSLGSDFADEDRGQRASFGGLTQYERGMNLIVATGTVIFDQLQAGDVTDLRQFWAAQGMTKPFRWLAPGDYETRLWRFTAPLTRTPKSPHTMTMQTKVEEAFDQG